MRLRIGNYLQLHYYWKGYKSGRELILLFGLLSPRPTGQGGGNGDNNYSYAGNKDTLHTKC